MWIFCSENEQNKKRDVTVNYLQFYQKVITEKYINKISLHNKSTGMDVCYICSHVTD